MLLILLVLMVFQGLHRWLQKIGLGRLPGDFRFRLFGREIFIPVGSSVVISLLAMGLSKLV
jgi:hypothetical protein